MVLTLILSEADIAQSPAFINAVAGAIRDAATWGQIIPADQSTLTNLASLRDDMIPIMLDPAYDAPMADLMQSAFTQQGASGKTSAFIGAFHMQKPNDVDDLLAGNTTNISFAATQADALSLLSGRYGPQVDSEGNPLPMADIPEFIYLIDEDRFIDTRPEGTQPSMDAIFAAGNVALTPYNTYDELATYSAIANNSGIAGIVEQHLVDAGMLSKDSAGIGDNQISDNEFTAILSLMGNNAEFQKMARDVAVALQDSGVFIASEGAVNQVGGSTGQQRER
jgi:hypothetical protein